MEGENDLINVLSMDNISNRDVTAYYMDTIYKAAQELSLKRCYDGPCRECPFRITSDDLIKAFDSRCFIITYY